VSSIVSAIYDGVLIANQDERIVVVNQGAASIFGVPAEELRVPLSELASRFRMRTPEGEPVQPIALAALTGDVVPWVTGSSLIQSPAPSGTSARSAAPLRSPQGEVEARSR